LHTLKYTAEACGQAHRKGVRQRARKRSARGGLGAPLAVDCVRGAGLLMKAAALKGLRRLMGRGFRYQKRTATFGVGVGPSITWRAETVAATWRKR